MINGKPAYMTSFDGNEGAYSVDGDPIILAYRTGITSVRDDPENRQGVHEADLSTYKDSSYFDAFVNTFSVMYLKQGEGFSQVTISTQDKEAKPIETARAEAYNTLKGIKFGAIETATFDGKITVKGNGSNIIVRNTDITIPGVLTVFKGTRDATQQVEIGGITVMKYESNAFDFYQYGDNLIKAAKGTVIEEYIEFKSL